MVPFCSVTANAQSQTTDIRPKAEKLQGDDLLKAFLGKTYEGAYNFSAEGEPRRFYEEVHHQERMFSRLPGRKLLLFLQ